MYVGVSREINYSTRVDVVRVDVLPNAIYVCECVSKRDFIVRKRLKSSSVQKILLHNPIITDSLVQKYVILKYFNKSDATGLSLSVYIRQCLRNNSTKYICV